MGLLKTAATAVSALGSVGAGVFNVVKGIGSVGSFIARSKVMKFAIGVGGAALLANMAMGNKNSGSAMSKITDKFASFIGGIGKSVASKAGTLALTAASAVSGVGTAVNNTVETMENDTSRTLSLKDVVIDQNFEAPAHEKVSPVQVCDGQPEIHTEPAAVEDQSVELC